MNYDKAYEIASVAHLGQKDKGGRPYIEHPTRLASKFESENEKIIAILHDVVEDTTITLDDLRAFGFKEVVLIAIDSLTRRKHESYDEFIERIKMNKVATKIKIEDIKDNMDLSRIENPTDKDFKRQDKYSKALDYLQAKG